MIGLLKKHGARLAARSARSAEAVHGVLAVQGGAKAARVAIAAAATLCVFALSACSGRLETTIRNDLSARMALRLDVPDPLSARVRQIGGIAPKTALFDIARLKEEFSNRGSIFLVDVSAPSADSLTSVVWVPDVEAFVNDRSIIPEGMISLRKIPASGTQPAQRELSVSLTRANAASAFALFPGIDDKLIDSLSPPALEKDPVTAAEYRMNLETVIIGKKSMPAFDACALEFNITAPRTILGSVGGAAQGQVFKAKIPLFDLLTLEKPIHFSLRWAD